MANLDPEIGESFPDAAITQAMSFVGWMDERMKSNQDQPRRKTVWVAVALVSFSVSLTCYQGVVQYLENQNYFHIVTNAPFPFVIGYPYLMMYLYFAREPAPRVLRRREKQLIESAFVVAGACWAYWERDGPGPIAALGPALCFDLIPVLNLWWCYDNFGFWDCCLIVVVDVALLCCRGGGGGPLAGVAAAGVALQLVKNGYRRYSSRKIKNQTDKHVV